MAAHGPVTADGARRAGVRVDVVGTRFGSFAGVVDWRSILPAVLVVVVVVLLRRLLR